MPPTNPPSGPVAPSLPRVQPVGHSDLRALYHAVLERSWIVALCFVVSAMATAAYLQHAPKIFAATATLQVEQMEQKVVKFEKVQEEDLRFLDVIRTIEQSLTSRPVLERVVQSLSLREAFTSREGIEPTKDEAIDILAGMVDVRLRRGTRLIDVTVKGPNASLCEKAANAIPKEYMKFSFEQQSASSQVANEFLLEEAKRLKNKLEQSEGNLQAYKEKMKSISLEERQDLVTTSLRELGLRVNEAKATRTRFEVEYEQVRKLGTNVTELLALGTVANNPSIAQIKLNLSKMENDFSNLKQRYKAKHPKFIQAEGQVLDWGQTLTNAVLNSAETIHASYESAKAAEEAMEQTMREQEKIALDLSRQAVQYNVLKREVESDRALYDAVLTRLKETGMTKDLQSDKVRILQLAYVSNLPVSPNIKKVLVLGLFGGLAAGIMLALGLGSLDNSLKTVDQVEDYLHLPVLTAIQQLKEVRGPKHELVVKEQAQSTGAEAFRTLRTAVSMLGREEARKSLLFTSAVPQEGKTFCSVNYALCLAQQGLRTILIDADLRRPALERVLAGKREQKPGVTDYLTGQKSLAQVVHPTDHGNLFYVPGGTTAPNPAELLAQGGLAMLVEELLRKCDRVVVDSAPVHAVSDTLLLVGNIQTVCVVVRSGKTPRKAIARAVQLLRKANAPLGGVVLNRLKVPKLGQYYYDPYYNYSYHKGYGRKGVYGLGEKKAKATIKSEPIEKQEEELEAES